MTYLLPNLMIRIFYTHDESTYRGFNLTVECADSLKFQACWGPDDGSVVFVGWFHEPYRLGVIYCPIRK